MKNRLFTALFACVLTTVNASDPNTTVLKEIDLFADVPAAFDYGIEEAAKKYPDLLRDEAPYISEFVPAFRRFAMVECRGDLPKALTSYDKSLDVFAKAFSDYLEEITRNHKDKTTRVVVGESLKVLQCMIQNKEEMNYLKLLEHFDILVQKLDSQIREVALDTNMTISRMAIENTLSSGYPNYPSEHYNGQGSYENYLKNYAFSNFEKLISQSFPTPMQLPAFGTGIMEIPYLVFHYLSNIHPFFGAIDPAPYHSTSKVVATLRDVIVHDSVHGTQANLGPSLYQPIKKNLANENDIQEALLTIEGFYNAVIFFFKEHAINKILLDEENEKKFREISAGLFILFHESGPSIPIMNLVNPGLNAFFDVIAEKTISFYPSPDEQRFGYPTCPITGYPFKNNQLLTDPEEFLKIYGDETIEALKKRLQITDEPRDVRATYIKSKDPNGSYISIIRIDFSNSGSELSTTATDIRDINDSGILEWADIKLPEPNYASMPLDQAYQEAVERQAFISKKTIELIKGTKEEFKNFIQKYDLEGQYARKLKPYQQLYFSELLALLASK